MAVTAHLEIFNGGVLAWNKWRANEPSVRPDLSGVELRGTGGVESAYDAFLQEIDLSNTNMRKVTITDALLSGGNFRKADLSLATIQDSNLTDCSLADSELLFATLAGCDLCQADLNGAALGGTKFIGVDLSYAKNLDKATHRFPSSIDVDTLEATIKGLRDRPAAFVEVAQFLKSAGVPAHYIEMVKLKIGLRSEPAK